VADDIFEDGPEYERQRPGRGLGGRIARAKFVPTCTEEGWNHLRGLVEDGLGDRVKLVYHGVDLALFDHREPSVGDPPLIVSVGRLVAYKGFDDVVAACGELHRRGVDFRCVIVGDGSQRPVLERMIAEQGLQDRVELAGSRPQAFVRDLLSRADVFVLCGKAEQGQYGLPNVLLEAAAMATPTVSRRLPSSYELVEHGGNGLLADTQEEVVDALEALLRDPERRRRLGAAARRTVEEKFDAEQTIELLADDLRAAAR
jgi:glycosyltransferase involved in cell wall biosynthesis